MTRINVPDLEQVDDQRMKVPSGIVVDGIGSPVSDTTGNSTRPSDRLPMAHQREDRPHGDVHVIPARCKECGYCVRFCPEQVLGFSTDTNAKGYHYPVLVEDSGSRTCVDCGFCSLICPELAIFSSPAADGT